MKKNRLSSLLLCIALTTGLLSGCGKATVESAASTPASTAAESAVSAPTTVPTLEDSSMEASVSEPVVETQWPEEPVTLTMYKPAHPALMDMIEQGYGVDTWSVWKWVSENLNINFDIDFVSMNDADTSYSLMFAAGDYSDIIYSAVDYYSTGAAGLLADDVIIDHRSLVEEYCPNMLEQMEQRGLAAYLTDEKLAGFFTIDQYEAYPEQGICIRQDWLDACGLEMPTTYDELHTVLSAFRSQMGADAALLLNDMGVMQANAMISGYGVAGVYAARFNNGADAFFVDDGAVKYGPAEDGFRDYLDMLAQWYSEGLIYKDFYVPLTFFDTVDPTVASGETGVFNDSVEDFYLDAAMVDDGSCKIVGMPNPTINKGDTYHIGYVSSTSTTPIWSITTACAPEKQKYVAMLVNFFYDGGAGTLLANYGIEGEAFEYNDEGKPQFTDLVMNNPNGYQTMMCYTFYTCESQDPILYDNHRAYAGYTDDQWAAFDAWRMNYEPTQNYAGALRAEDETDYAKCYADISTYVQEYVCNVIIGEASLDATWDSYLLSLSQMGLQECIDYRQHAYDDYIG